MPDLKFSTQNVQSLNVSVKGIKTFAKLKLVTAGQPDIIFLSDTRLNSNENKYGLTDIQKQLGFLGYIGLFNSNVSSRGVGILIKKSLEPRIISEKKGPLDNYYLVKLHCNNFEEDFIVGSIYGPNDNNLSFFTHLERDLNDLNSPIMILGGDWNLTLDDSPVNENMDCFNMQNIPSKKRSEMALQMCKKLSLVDPFRMLYPNRREFTYVPNDPLLLNRSRLDFFLVTKNISQSVRDCKIADSVVGRFFDHKSVNLTMGGWVRKCNKNGILKNEVLKNPEFVNKIRVTVIDFYLQHVNPETYPRNELNDKLEQCGLIYYKIKKIGEEKTRILNAGGTEETNAEINRLREDIEGLFSHLPDNNSLQALELSCQPDVFFETLVMSIKNQALSQQAEYFRAKSERKKKLSKRLRELKATAKENLNMIFNLERELSQILEMEIREEVISIKNFERLNNEKMTPYFLKVAKTSVKQPEVDKICDNKGDEFLTEADRDNHITGFYKKLYTEPRKGVTVNQQDILDFLGETVEKQEVQNSILTDTERDELDRELNISEFDTVIKQIRKNTAPGIDRISYSFIKFFWSYLRVPLYRYAIHCYDNNKLTDNFKTAKIRIIPKKGQIKDIKNWRPISLLSCFYKILSRVLANRLKKYMDKLTAIGQKSASKQKVCQEVLIDLLDGIQYCKRNRKAGAILSLDIKKAFDSTGHSYIGEVYKFFNFGPSIQKWLNLTGTNRRACVILSGDRMGEIFDLERGNAQGDTISPFIFNLGFQILLFKLNFDLQIDSLIKVPAVPPDYPPLPEEVSISPRKVFTFADDNNIFTTMRFETLNRIKEVLNEFKMLSGLECNVEKSVLMQVGEIIPVTDEIKKIGFKIEEKIKVLGLIIEQNSVDFNDSWGKIEEKVREQKRFWERLNLSLPGRITIAKTMMYSQVNYLGSFLPLKEDRENRIQNIINTFVCGRLKVSDKRIYEKPEKGGLGIFNLKTFLGAQKCAWVKRARNLDELWKIRLYTKSYGNVLNLRRGNFDKESEPILYGIVVAYEDFLYRYTETNCYRNVFIFENSRLTFGLQDRNFLTARFFNNEFFRENRLKIYNLRCGDFFLDGRFKTRENFNNSTNIRLDLLQYERCKAILKTAEKRYGSRENFLDKNLEDFFNFDRGSRKYRKILTKNWNEEVPHNLVKFSDNTDTIINYRVGADLNAIWNWGFFSGEFRTFLFKLHNNRLGYNYILAKFIRGTSENCTFCEISRNPHSNRDNPLHLFFNCETTEALYNNFFGWLLMGTREEVPRRQEFFTIFERSNNYLNITLTITSKLFIFYLWQCKLRKQLPEIEHVKIFVLGELKIFWRLSTFMKDAIKNANIPRLRAIGADLVDLSLQRDF